MSADERLTCAMESKEEGNNLFKQGDFSGASKCYRDAIDMCDNMDDWPEDLQATGKPIRLSSNLNAANAYIKLGSWLEASLAATAALAVDPVSSKALYRRGLARIELGELDAAKGDLTAAAKLEPSSAEIRSAYAKCQQANKEYNQKSKEAFARMFATKSN